MPIYEYSCQKCGHCFEYLHFVGDDAPPTCPQCDAKKVKRQLSCFATGGQGGADGLSGLGHGSGGGCGSGGFS